MSREDNYRQQPSLLSKNKNVQSPYGRSVRNGDMNQVDSKRAMDSQRRRYEEKNKALEHSRRTESPGAGSLDQYGTEKVGKVLPQTSSVDFHKIKSKFADLMDVMKGLPETVSILEFEAESHSDTLMKQISEKDQKIKELEETLRRFPSAKDQSESRRLQSKDATIASLESDIKRLQAKQEETKTEYVKLESAHNEYRERAKELLKKAENKEKELQDENNSKEGIIKSLREQIREAESAKQNALTRLSKQMGSQLSDENAQIADLSDKDRPTKLGERYNELYDNQWTEALEHLENKGHSERQCVERLFQILKKCYEYCSQLATATLNKMKNAVGIETTLPASQLDRQEKDIVKNLKDARKQMSGKMLPQRFEDFWRAEYSYRDKPIQPYVKECFEICWYMAVADPPLYLEFDIKEGDFNTNLYKHYTATGARIDYIVWPVLYLYKDGPVVSKGVAQPLPSQDRRNTRRKQAWEEKSSKSSESPVTTSDPMVSASRPIQTSHFSSPTTNTASPAPVSSPGSYQMDVAPTVRQIPGGQQFQSTDLRSAYDQQAYPYNHHADYDQQGNWQNYHHQGQDGAWLNSSALAYRPTSSDFDNYFQWMKYGGEELTHRMLGDKIFYACKNYLESTA